MLRMYRIEIESYTFYVAASCRKAAIAKTRVRFPVGKLAVVCCGPV